MMGLSENRGTLFGSLGFRVWGLGFGVWGLGFRGTLFGGTFKGILFYFLGYKRDNPFVWETSIEGTPF